MEVSEDEGEDEDDGYDNQTAFAGIGVVFFIVGAVLVEGVGVFFGGFVVWEHG